MSVVSSASKPVVASAATVSFEPLSYYDGENLDSYVNFGGNYQYKKKKSSKYHVFPDMPDWSYLRMTPPGLPNFFSARETEWSRVAWSSVWDD